MSGWLLSILGVTVIGVLVELLLTDNPMSKFIRSIYAFFILFVIVQPLPAFFRDGISVGAAIQPDTAIIQTINANSATAFARNAENTLAGAGYPNVIVTIDYDKTATSFKIQKIYVNTWNSTNINVPNVIKIVATVCSVDEEVVEVFAK